MNADIVEIAKLICIKVDSDKWWYCKDKCFGLNKSERVAIDCENKYSKKTLVLRKMESTYIVCILEEKDLWKYYY